MNYNLLTITGNVGQDPEIRETLAGKKYATFSVATSRKVGLDEEGKPITRTDWHRVQAWSDTLVEVAEKYIRKGSLVLVTGPLHYNTYVKGEQKMTSAQVRAYTIIKLDRPKNEDVPTETASAEYDEDAGADYGIGTDDEQSF